MTKSSPKGWKTMWEKEKLLITSNFSFSCIVFKKLVLQTHKRQGLFGKGLRSIILFALFFIQAKKAKKGEDSDEDYTTKSKQVNTESPGTKRPQVSEHVQLCSID